MHGFVRSFTLLIPSVEILRIVCLQQQSICLLHRSVPFTKSNRSYYTLGSDMWFRAPKQDVENQTDFAQGNEISSFNELLKKIQDDILQLQHDMESLKKNNGTEYNCDDNNTCISIQRQGSHPQEIEINDISQPNTLAKQEHQRNEDLISIKDIKCIVQSLQCNQDFQSSLGSIVQEKVDTSLPDLVQAQAQTTQKSNLTPTTKRSSLNGINSSPMRKGRFEEDFYSMMMLSIVRSRAWCFGIICFIMQMTLATIIIIEQTQTKFLETDMRIPIKVSILPRIAQVLAIILAIMTQNEFLMGIRTIMILPYKDKTRWGTVIGIDEDKCNKMRWFQHIFLPNFLKSVQGGMVLVASFIVIIQIDTTVDVLKDYSALFVVSSVDNLFFNFADMGYLGEKLSIKAEKMKKIELDENERRVWKTLAALLVTLITAFMTTYGYITVGQVSGKYVKQAYPICPVKTGFENEGNSFLDIIGDGTCQFPQGRGTNIIECGWDGSDCETINERFPKCTVDDFSLLGDGNCEIGTYNSEACGFDNGDCVDFNTQKEEKYPNCNVENIGWIGDGICNGGDYASDECESDGGDCANCKVDNIDLVGDDNCDGSLLNKETCGFDGGDCAEFNQLNQKRYLDCNVENIGWIGDGICNGGDYASDECESDGGDCANCAVNDMSLVGDGNCEGSTYNSKGCSFDGGDCTEFNKLNQERYPNCNVENIGWIGDGICNGGDYASTDCENDGGDCSNCTVNDMNLVGDGSCDDSAYNNKACSFDGGDCTNFNQQKSERHPNCNVENIGWIEDGFCDEENNVDNCLFDGNDCVPAMELIGDKHRIVGGWVGGVLGHDGNIYGIPYRATRILKIYSLSNAAIDLGGEKAFNSNLFNEDAFNITNITTITNIKNTFVSKNQQTPLVGSTFRETKAKWFGGVVGENGIIYGVPYDMNSILSYNTTSKKTKLIAEGHSLLTSNSKFSGGVLSKNGTIHLIPSSYKKVVKFDPFNLKNPLTEIGDDLGKDADKMRSGVLGSDGNIYAIPYSGTRVLKINIGDDTTSFIGDEYPDSRKWMNGVLAKDGNIYACPFGANQILQINVQNQTTNLVGPALGDWKGKWSGFVEGEDGFLYGMPYSSNELLRFDPIHHSATMIPSPEEMHEGRKWRGGVRAGKGIIYAIPYDAEQVISIAPLEIRP